MTDFVSDEALLRAYELSSDRYDERFRPLQAPKYAALLAHSPPHPGERLLDLGCGTGLFAEILAPRLERPPVGLDVAARMLAPVRSRGGLPVRGTMLRLPFRDGSFERVYAVTSFLLEPARVVSVFLEVARVLVPAGAFAFTMLEADAWPGLEEDLAAAGFRIEARFAAGQDVGRATRRGGA